MGSGLKFCFVPMSIHFTNDLSPRSNASPLIALVKVHNYSLETSRSWAERDQGCPWIQVAQKFKLQVLDFLQTFWPGLLPPVSSYLQFSSAQLLSHVHFFVAPWTEARQASLSVTNSQSLLKLMSTESVIPSNHLILCCPLLLLPPIFPSIGVFSNELVLRIRRPKYWSFSFSFSSSNEYSGLISFRMDWLDLLAVQGTLKSIFQHYSSKASILQSSASLSNSHIHTWPLEEP